METGENTIQVAKKRLLDVDPFQLFPKQGDISVSLRLIQSGVVVSRDELKTLEEFYETLVIRHSMEIDNPLFALDAASKDGPLFVPVVNATKKVALDYARDALIRFKCSNCES